MSPERPGYTLERVELVAIVVAIASIIGPMDDVYYFNLPFGYHVDEKLLA